MGIPLKAVIFDYGNVLCLPQLDSDLQEMASIFEMRSAEYAPLYWRDRYPYDEGRLTPEAYWEAVAHQAGKPLTAANLADLRRLDIQSWRRPSPPMVHFAKSLRAAGIKTAVLSNMPLDLRRYLPAHEPWFPEFDHLTFSCDVQITKPQPGIYHHCLDGLGVRPGEALFLDDREDNVDAAREIGIHAAVFRTPADAVIQIAPFDLPVGIEC